MSWLTIVVAILKRKKLLIALVSVVALAACAVRIAVGPRAIDAVDTADAKCVVVVPSTTAKPERWKYELPPITNELQKK